MIQMQVREQDGIDLFWLITGGFDVRRQLTRRGTDALPRPGIHQDQLFAGVHQKRIEGGLHPRCFNRTTSQ